MKRTGYVVLALSLVLLGAGMVNKILHHPISQMKDLAGDPQAADFVDTVRRIFNIKFQ